MLPVSTIIEKLQEASAWSDGENLDAIRERLAPEQLAASGCVTLRISERGALPWLLRARVEQHGVLLFETILRLPAGITHANIEAIVQEWQAQGHLLGVTIHPLNNEESP